MGNINAVLNRLVSRHPSKWGSCMNDVIIILTFKWPWTDPCFECQPTSLKIATTWFWFADTPKSFSIPLMSLNQKSVSAFATKDYDMRWCKKIKHLSTEMRNWLDRRWKSRTNIIKTQHHAICFWYLLIYVSEEKTVRVLTWMTDQMLFKFIFPPSCGLTRVFLSSDHRNAIKSFFN